MSDHDDIINGSKTIAGTIFIVTICALFVGLIVAAIYVVTPWFNSMETKATEHSYTAVSSKKELLLKLNQDYMKLESQKVEAEKTDPELAKTYKAQQIAIINRMKIESQTLPPAEVPPEVQLLIH